MADTKQATTTPPSTQSTSAAAPAGKKPAARTWASARENTSQIPEGVWRRCERCEKMLYRGHLEEDLWVCRECGHHHRVSATQRIAQLEDTGSFVEMFTDIAPCDPLKFKDLKAYPDRLLAEQIKTGARDSIKAGTMFIKGRQAMVACLDPAFMMGSMGSVVGEVLTRSIEYATQNDLPIITVSCSGGARMQESGLSLMQMAKTSAALARLDEAGGFYISVLADPTTGGVTASFAMLGHVIIAEPNALIGFAGPRVIQQTIRQELPEGFQRSEFLKKAGFVDRVVPRSQMRNELARLIDYAGK